jgi:RNA polymerase primary sigma factor
LSTPTDSTPDVTRGEKPRGPRRLPAELEHELVAAAEAGDGGARERLVKTFMPSIAGMARAYQRSSSVDRTELIQEGVVGLFRALGRYDLQMGTPFWAYASWWVRQAMQQLVAEVTRPMVLSDRALRGLARIKAARSEHIRQYQREPTTADLVAATELTRQQVESLLAAERAPRSFQEPLADEEGAAGTLGDLVADPAAEDEYERVLEGIEVPEIRDLSEALDERERSILSAHYGLGRPRETLREIAEDLGVSVERVRQIEERTLQKLRAAAATPAPAGLEQMPRT